MRSLDGAGNNPKTVLEITKRGMNLMGINYVIDNGKRMKIRVILIYFVGWACMSKFLCKFAA